MRDVFVGCALNNKHTIKCLTCDYCIIMRSSVTDDCRTMLGRLELEMAINYNQLENLRITTFYVSKLYSYILYGIDADDEEDKRKDLETLKKIHEDLRRIQETIIVGVGENRENWKKVLSKLSQYQFVAGSIGAKYGLVQYMVEQFAEFKK